MKMLMKNDYPLIDPTDEGGHTALHIAISKGEIETVGYLLSKGARRFTCLCFQLRRLNRKIESDFFTVNPLQAFRRTCTVVVILQIAIHYLLVDIESIFYQKHVTDIITKVSKVFSPK